MASGGRHSGPHGSGAQLEDFRDWRSFVHLARELKLSRLAQYASPYRTRAILGVVAMVIFTVSGLAVPRIIGEAIDRGVLKNDLHMVDLLIALFVTVTVVNLAANYVMTYLVSWVGERVILDLRHSLFAHIQKLSLDFFSRQKTGWIVSRLTNDIDALEQLVTDGVTTLITNGLTLMGAVIVLFWLDARLAAATLSILPGLLVATLVFRALSSRTYALLRDKVGNVNANLQESVAGMRVLIAFRREDANFEQLRRSNAENRDTNMRTVVQSGFYFPFVELLSGIGTIVVLWYGGYLVTKGVLGIGELVAFIAYLSLFLDPVQQLSQLYNTFQAAMAAVQKIFTVLDTEPDMVDAPDAVPLPEPRGDVEFRNVGFAYVADTPVLRDVSFHIRPGGTVALVGTTGAGKSTIVKLLARFYDPLEGSVSIDGHDLRTVTMASLRAQLAVVPQEAHLFSGSVLDNIRFSRPEAALEEVKRVARIVGVHEFVEALPNGYDTEVQEGGSGLSTGQRQLISFARALLADPQILILDEATSSVDAASERKIERAMQVLLSGRSSVIVAHRLSTVRYADEILVVEGGSIIERGTHDELVALSGRYAGLYTDWQKTGQAI